MIFADSTTGPALREFSSRQFHLRFKYPANWPISNPTPAGQIFSAGSPARPDGHFCVVSLRIDHAAQDLSDDALLVDVSDTLASYIFKNGGRHVKIKPEKLGLLPARRITFENDSDAGPIKTACIVAIKDRVEYVFNFTGPVQAFDSLLPAVNDLLNSFELLE